MVQKRLFDLVCSALGLLALTPLFILAAILIKLDSPGPVFFVQRRYGFNQQPFRIIKFRTMRALDDGAVVTQATRDDPRLTRIGRWLRRWNIDEIPQLFNVLAGDMSLVGPRPHALSHDHEFERRISLYARRHNVKPGHYRLGADQWLPRRNRQRREARETRGTRLVLYRQLVAVARSEDHRAHGAVAQGLPQRSLSSIVIASHGSDPEWPARRQALRSNPGPSIGSDTNSAPSPMLRPSP
ncbi:MAG: sugar transferase [Xanthobacteraceae bacterium]